MKEFLAKLLGLQGDIEKLVQERDQLQLQLEARQMQIEQLTAETEQLRERLRETEHGLLLQVNDALLQLSTKVEEWRKVDGE